jgi:hypothetical protein
MQLYTVVFEYKGGTYIRQLPASSPEAALKTSVTTLSSILNESMEKLAESVEDPDVVPIDECRNVWAGTGLLNSSLLLVHIVATAG